MNYTDLISLYLQGDATPAQKAELSRWISSDEANYQVFLRLKNVWEVEHPAFSEEEVEKMKVRERNKLLGHGNRRGLLHYYTAAAAVLVIPLCFATAFLAVKAYRGADREETLQQVSCAYGTVTRFMLPDGSEVCLNAGSTLSFPSVFNASRRRVSLTGEAYFEVLSDAQHPFVVNAAGMDIVATGTKFNVEAYPGCPSRVTLVSGSVDIVKDVTTYVLKPGHQFQYGPDGSVTKALTDPFKWTAWKDGIIAFRGDRLSYVFERLSQTYNARIVIEDPQVADLQIRATFKGERLDEIMSLLERCAPMRCVRQSGDFEDDFTTEYHIFLKE